MSRRKDISSDELNAYGEQVYSRSEEVCLQGIKNITRQIHRLNKGYDCSQHHVEIAAGASDEDRVAALRQTKVNLEEVLGELRQQNPTYLGREQQRSPNTEHCCVVA